MDGNTFQSMQELKSARIAAEWEGRFLYAALLQRLYLLSYCHANNLPINTGDY